MPTSSADRPAPVLEVEALVAGYGGAPIVHGVDLGLGGGEIATIVGPNGAGKSTLLKAITGQIQVLSGTVSLEGAAVTGLAGEKLARRGIGLVPQVKDIFPTLTVQENLEMGGYLLPRRKLGTRIAEVLDVFPALGAMRARTASKLSGGERKMLAIGRVLMLRPKVVIFDEPTSNLSPALARAVLEDHLQSLSAAGSAVLLVEQKATDALAVSHWAYVMVAGLVHLEGPAAELSARDDIGELFLGRVAGA
jgi:branched-chain amino acid transport system ATP-binding protein